MRFKQAARKLSFLISCEINEDRRKEEGRESGVHKLYLFQHFLQRPTSTKNVFVNIEASSQLFALPST
jgi:hypothetical protein